MGNNIRSSSRPKALAPSIPMPPLADAMDAVHLSVDRFCLLAGVEALAEMWRRTPRPCAGPDIASIWGRTHRDRLPRRQSGWPGHGFVTGRAELGELAGATHGNLLLEWALNHGAERVDPRPRGPSRGDLAKARGGGQVGRFPALCGAVTQEDEGLARLGSLGTRPASHPDRRRMSATMS